MPGKALEGIRVLDIATVIAAPWAAGIMADFGADVIKVEMPGRGDAVRAMGPHKNGKSLRWPMLGRNKRSITLDFHSEKGKALFLKLVEKADVVIENFKTGTLDKWGVGVEEMRKHNPNIIVSHVTGYGQTGPNRFLAGLGMPLQAYSGYVYMQGYEDRPPVNPPFPLADYVAGLYTVIGTMFALYYRDAKNGRGQEIDVSLYEGIFRMEESAVAQLDQLGIVYERAPHSRGSSCPIGTFKTKDGRFVIMVCSTNPVFDHLCDAMERPEWKTPYTTAKERLADADYLNKEVADWFAARTYEEAKAACDKAGVPLSAVYSMQDIFNDPHYAARNDILTVPTEDFGPMKMPGVFPVMSETPGEVKWAGPRIGEHTEEVLHEWLGLSAEEVAALRADGAI